MRIVALGNDVIGKVLARGVYTADGRVLLRSGVKLTAAYVGHLIQKGYTSVYVHNELVPGLEASDAIKEATRVRATALMTSALDDARSSRPIDYVRIGQVVDDILADLHKESGFVFELSTLRSIDDYSFVHSVNVCVLSIILGQSLYLGYRDLKRLGVGAILHDIGKVKVPVELLLRKGSLNPAEFELVKAHTNLGFEIIRSHPEFSMVSAHVALQHHERLDGSGYPRGLRGGEILDFGLIAGVADVYDALVSDRPHRPGYNPADAMQQLVRGAGTLFDERLVRQLIEVVAVYPVGSIVQLSDGTIAVVVRQQRGRPSHPVVAVITDPLYTLVTPVEFGLETRPGLQVTAVLPDYPDRVKEQLTDNS
ncbi:MAG: HD-GYP domain-containing protein [Bacillota bacterium]